MNSKSTAYGKTCWPQKLHSSCTYRHCICGEYSYYEVSAANMFSHTRLIWNSFSIGDSRRRNPPHTTLHPVPEQRLPQRRPHHLDAPQIARTHAQLLGELQGAVALLERRRAADGQGVVAHHSHAHGVGSHAVVPATSTPGRMARDGFTHGPSPPAMERTASTIARSMGRAATRSATMRGTR